jgi:hypothetical protein
LAFEAAADEVKLPVQFRMTKERRFAPFGAVPLMAAAFPNKNRRGFSSFVWLLAVFGLVRLTALVHPGLQESCGSDGAVWIFEFEYPSVHVLNDRQSNSA